MSLADYFPENLREEYAQRSIKIGTVLKLFVQDTKPPKIKRFIVIGLSPDGISLATVYINSEININIHWNDELKELQVPFDSSTREYLDEDSFVDCSKFFFKEKNEIEKILTKRPKAIIGELNEDDLNTITEKIKTNKTIKGKIKRKYGIYTD